MPLLSARSLNAILATLVCLAPSNRLVTVQSARLGVRNAHALAYDAKRREVILFGGADDRAVLSDTWTWNGRQWKRVSTGGPLPRTFAAVATDPIQNRVFLYGGNRVLFGTGQPTDTVLGDFWSWNGMTWASLSSVGPGSRAEAAMAFDHTRNRLVLFGGYRGTGSQRVRLGDTWEWEGTTWSQVASTGPTPRNNSAMVYDPDRRVTVLFGGSDGTASGETWEWDGRVWRRSEAPVVEARYNPVMAYDPVRKLIVRFGGWNGRERLGDTWLFDGRAWARQNVLGPSPRNHAAFAFDVERGRAVLVGGHDGSHVFGDTWEWLGDRWMSIDSVPSRARVDNGH